MSFGLLILRLVVGLTFVAHGSQKLFGWFGGYGIAGTGGFLEQLGFHPGKRAALLAGLAEAGGGALLALGLATPLAATLIVSVMLVAVATLHFEKGFFASSGGYEYNLVLAVTALAVVIAGPGRFSLDQLLGIERAGLIWGLGSLAAGLAGGALQLATRHRAPVPQGAKPKTA